MRFIVKSLLLSTYVFDAAGDSIRETAKPVGETHALLHAIKKGGNILLCYASNGRLGRKLRETYIRFFDIIHRPSARGIR